MNEILQKRIEEAAKKYCQDKNYILPDDTELSLEALTAIDAYIEAAKSILKNQWISVDEGLPKVNELVFGCVNDEGNPQAVGMAYYDEYGGWHYSDEEEISLITHWMPIPSLEGGEK